MRAASHARRVFSASRKAALAAARWSGALPLAGARLGGIGVIYMLHRVSAPEETNLHLGYRVSTDQLEATLRAVQRRSLDVIPIDDVEKRLSGSSPGRRFVCFGFDDGYVDNLTLALPLFRKYSFPFTVHVATGLVRRELIYWWGALEELARRADEIRFTPPGEPEPRTMPCRTLAEKRQAFDTLDALCHRHGMAFFEALGDELRARGVDAAALLDRDALTVAQLRELASDPLVTIASHSVTHRPLGLLAQGELEWELAASRGQLERWLDREIRHLAYPFGKAEACSPREFAAAARAGYRSAVTTRRGNLFPAHSEFLHCLPRRCIPSTGAQFENTLYGIETLARGEPLFQTN